MANNPWVARAAFAAALIGLIGTFACVNPAKAEETDQFTLTPGALVDIGPTISDRLYGVLEDAVKQTNSEIRDLLVKASDDPSDKGVADELAERRTDSYIVNLIYQETGVGLPEASWERWVNWEPFPKELQPMRYNETWSWNTIYWMVFSQTPLALTLLSPTINMYGHYFGTDKVGHFFQQGEGYYEIYTSYLAHGQTEAQARAAIVAHGQSQEHGFFGTALDGVFSNGDLSANYAGWKFYMNLAHTVKIGSQALQPILALKGDQWEFARTIDKDDLLKPYINDNLSEALNPCRYFFDRGLIRKHVKARCASWIKRFGITKESVRAKLTETSSWEGEDYGHWLPDSDAITLESCFGGR